MTCFGIIFLFTHLVGVNLQKYGKAYKVIQQVAVKVLHSQFSIDVRTTVANASEYMKLMGELRALSAALW